MLSFENLVYHINNENIISKLNIKIILKALIDRLEIH